ncbi:hypothetical protein ACFLVI_02470 [Chloroflexota bacterium]
MKLHSGGKVIVVDDKPGIAKSLTKWLMKAGYSYILVDDVHAANNLLKYNKFDAILYCHEFLFAP